MLVCQCWVSSPLLCCSNVTNKTDHVLINEIQTFSRTFSVTLQNLKAFKNKIQGLSMLSGHNVHHVIVIATNFTIPTLQQVLAHNNPLSWWDAVTITNYWLDTHVLHIHILVETALTVNHSHRLRTVSVHSLTVFTKSITFVVHNINNVSGFIKETNFIIAYNHYYSSCILALVNHSFSLEY